MVHLHNGALKNNTVMKFVGKWIELGRIILSRVTQTQKNKHGLYSLINGYLDAQNRIARLQYTALKRLH